MDHEVDKPRTSQYQPESWRDSEPWENEVMAPAFGLNRQFTGGLTRGLTMQSGPAIPGVREQTRVLELLGCVNYRIIQGKKVYVEAGGVVYKTLYGGYWRSVFTGMEHHLLRCEQVSGSIWAEDGSKARAIDLPIGFSRDGWTASGHSLTFMLSREAMLPETHRKFVYAARDWGVSVLKRISRQARKLKLGL